MTAQCIVTVACFFICVDDEVPHAHIALKDGRLSPPLFSQKEARRLVKQLQWENCIEKDEQTMLYEQVDNSELPYYYPECIEEAIEESGKKVDEDGYREIDIYRDFYIPIDAPETKHSVH